MAGALGISLKLGPYSTVYPSYRPTTDTIFLVDDLPRTFMGRLAREMLAVCEPQAATLVPGTGAWHGARTPHHEVYEMVHIFFCLDG